MKDFEATVQLRNNQIKKRRLAAGMNKRQLSIASRVSQTDLGRYESLKISPLTRAGLWRKSAKVLAEYFNCDCEDIWPETILAIKESMAVMELNANEFSSLAAHQPHKLLEAASPSDLYDIEELHGEVKEVLNTLTPRERRIIEMRFGLGGNDEHALEEVARGMSTLDARSEDTGSTGITTERVRQIEAKALRKLRHPNNTKKLLEFISGRDFCDRSSLDEENAP